MSACVKRIDALTSLRFFAALLVVVFHHGQAAVTSAPLWLQSLVKGGYVGVPFFFVLSGFILAYNYLPLVRMDEFNTRRFLIARFARIYPVYLVALLIGVPIVVARTWQATTPEESMLRMGAQFAASAGLMQSWIPSWAFSWNGPAWSLSVEAFFYLTFPIFITRLDQRRRWKLLIGLGCGAFLLVAGGRLLSWNVVGHAQHLLGWTNPILWLALFVLGICLGDIHLRRKTTATSGSHRVWIVIGTVVLIALIVCLVSSGLQRRSQLLLCYTVAGPCAFLVLFLAEPGNLISRWFAWRGLILLGEASYSLYILHRPVHDWFEWLSANGFVHSTGTIFGFGFYLIACLAISVGALKGIEQPCREWFKHRVVSPRLGVELPRQSLNSVAEL